MPRDLASDLRANLANTRAWLDDYQRVSQVTERSIAQSVMLTRDAIAQSRDLLDRIERPVGK